MSNDDLMKLLERGSVAAREFAQAILARERELDALPPLPDSVREALSHYAPEERSPGWRPRHERRW
jgi:hypothetical protein